MDAHSSPDILLFGLFRFDRRGGLFRSTEDGRHLPVSIGARALAVLKALTERPGELVTKDEIMRAAWPGTVVEEGNLTVQISTLRRILDAGSDGASCIQTVSGRGYRFVPRVRHEEESVAAIPAPALAADPTEPPWWQSAPARLRVRSWSWPAAGSGAVAIVVLLMAAMWHGGWIARTPVPPRLSIVVLPFENLSGDPKEDYLADGITEDVTTDLSRIQGMFVVARESAYTYRGRAVDVRKVGEELGVRYAIEGSARKLGDMVRVNAQLIATETGAHLWADRFDQQLKDLGEGQEAIVRLISQSLNVALTDVENARSKRERPTNPDAFDLILRARALYLGPVGSPEIAARIALFERARRIDPTSIFAMTELAHDLIYGLVNFRIGNQDTLDLAAKLIADAAAINPNDPGVLAATAFLLRAQDRYTEAIAAYQRLMDEYPNAHLAYSQIGMLLTFSGRSQEAVPMIETAIRRDPQNPSRRYYYDNLGFALLMLGRDEESIVWARRALAATPNTALFDSAQYNLHLAAAYARLGRLEEAHSAVADANRHWPYDTVRSHWPDDPSSKVYAAQIERFQAALRLAGHRDHAEEDADFGIASDDKLHQNFAGLTPMTVPGATTIQTAELMRLITERKPIVIDPLAYFWGRSLPSAVGLKNAGFGGSTSDAMQDRLRKKMQALTKGNLATPIVAVGWNSERSDGRNLALRLVALGYTNVYWYRGGREAWEVNDLPETTLDVQEW